jgi:hypothetical protein
MNDLIERIEAATPESAEREELGIAINEALDIASYITDDGDPTQSIDAAVTLVPDGYSFNLGNDVKPWAHIWFDVPAYDGKPYEGRAATPALALCAAALKARAYLKETNNAD